MADGSNEWLMAQPIGCCFNEWRWLSEWLIAIG
jgi:hypothetical protein